MAYEEKTKWAYFLASPVINLFYIWIVLSRAGDGPLTEVAYGWTMFWAVLITIGLMILSAILFNILSPQDSDKADERDKSIERYGEYIGHIIFSILMMGVLIMTVHGYDHFWIAHAIFFACFLATMIGTAVKLVAYRRGFRQW